MQVAMMTRQHLTPPTLELDDFLDLPALVGSISTASTFNGQDGSPQSVLTAGTTPSTTSPARFRDSGPQLLPRVRSQDQIMEAAPRQTTHMRTQSMPCTNGYPMQLPTTRSYCEDQNNFFDFNPALAAPVQTYPMIYAAGLDVSQQPLSAPITSVRSHSRNTSTSSIDASIVNRYRYPTYRNSPTPQPQGLSCTADALSHLAPLAMLNGTSNYAPRSRNVSPTHRSRLSEAIEIPITTSTEQTCLSTYLTKPNPTPRTIQQVVVDRVGADSFWWDVRNVYEWKDFNISTILSIEGFAGLLNCSVDLTTLPEPSRVNLVPDTRAQLAELCSSHHLVKLNAALALAQGNRHLAARARTQSAAFKQQAEFVSNYYSDAEKTIFGAGKGRVVGIVRGFEEWNSGMRGEDPVKRIEYLRGLASLHRQMREHGCRYGFIMSEIELVCVRAGGPDVVDRPPLFGYLELSAPVPISRHGPAKDGSLQMTVGVALWYLHMLARDTPLPGQMDWRLSVGGPAAATRRHHNKKDDWIPAPTINEKRNAKRARGWFMPDEPISSTERGKTKKSRK